MTFSCAFSFGGRDRSYGNLIPPDHPRFSLSTHLPHSFRAGVEGVVILSVDGVPIRTTLDKERTIQFAALFSHLSSKAASLVKKINERDELQVVRLRSLKHEIIITPEANYILIVVQNPKV